MIDQISSQTRWYKTHVWALLLLLLLIMVATACSQRSLSLFFDIPEQEIEQQTEKNKHEQKAAANEASPANPAGQTAATGSLSTQRPEIESIESWDEARQLLPTTSFGEIDWMSALRQGIIKPRTSIDGKEIPGRSVFNYNFYIEGPIYQLDAVFSHSSHTEWLTCKNCHPVIFTRRGHEMTMKQLENGEFCGVCHGKVAFGLKYCERCHILMNEQGGGE